MREIPTHVLDVAHAISKAGGRALLVGGCVRDPIMGRTPKDWDLEVYQTDAERLREILMEFGPVNAVGEAFTVYKLGHDLDVSIPRRERKSGRGHRGFLVEGDPSMTTEDATRRHPFDPKQRLGDRIQPTEVVDQPAIEAGIGECALHARE